MTRLSPDHEILRNKLTISEFSGLFSTPIYSRKAEQIELISTELLRSTAASPQYTMLFPGDRPLLNMVVAEFAAGEGRVDTANEALLKYLRRD